MLAYVLALVVALGSVALYMAAFFLPEVHRKGDLVWSGVGMFYALVLWVCAGRITGGVLLGQTASVALLGWLGWQTLALRRQSTPLDQQTPLSAEELQTRLKTISSSDGLAKLSGQLSGQLTQAKEWVQAALSSTKASKPSPDQSERAPYTPLTPDDFAPSRRAKEGAIEAEAEPIASSETSEPAVPPTSVDDPWLTSVPTDTVAAASAPVATPVDTAPTTPVAPATPAPATKPAAPSLLEVLKSVLGDLTKKRESKPTYVRKQFRTPETPAVVDVDEPDAEFDQPDAEFDQPEGEKASENPVTVEAVTTEVDIADPPEPEILIEECSLPADSLLLDEIFYESNQHDDLLTEQERTEPAAGASEPSDDPPGLIRPNPPDPSLVEAALHDAEEKRLPADPPEIGDL